MCRTVAHKQVLLLRNHMEIVQLVRRHLQYPIHRLAVEWLRLVSHIQKIQRGQGEYL